MQGLPLGAVKNAMQRDGLDPSIMDLDPEKSVTSQLENKEDGAKSSVGKLPENRGPRRETYKQKIQKLLAENNSMGD